MAFIPGFEHDILISYAHDNNPGGEEGAGGWVTQFHRLLEEQLRQLTHRDLRIWRDRRLDRNQEFDKTIKEAIDSSAIFVSINSIAYKKSPYCQQEIEWFNTHVQHDGFGMSIGDRKRIFNVLLNNLHFSEWPAPFQGATGYNFFEQVPDDDVALPAEPGSEQFKAEFRTLLRHLSRTLNKFKEVAEQRAAEAQKQKMANDNGHVKTSDALTIFLAETSDELHRRLRQRLITELKVEGFVFTDDVPLGKAAEHDQALLAAVQQADLCLHLFDGSLGRDLPDLANQFYPQRQAELAKPHAKAQIIWVPNAVNLDANIDDDEAKTAHLRFLKQLESAGGAERTYTFIREPLTAEAIKRIVLEFREQWKKAKAVSAVPSSALFDGHYHDISHATQLYPHLQMHLIHLRINIGGDNPREKIEVLLKELKEASCLVVMFGQSGKDWVRHRLIETIKLSLEEDGIIKPCSICYVPPRTLNADGSFSFGMLEVKHFDRTETLIAWLTEPC